MTATGTYPERCRHTLVFMFTILGILAVLSSGVEAQQSKKPGVDEWKNRYTGELQKWKHYSTSLRAGRIDEAGRLLKELEAALPAGDARADFWAHVLPPDRRIVVYLQRVCEKCIDGHCTLCGGVGVCQVCLGDRRCVLCKGVGVKRSACTKCLCPECHGTGFCTKCLSRKSFACTKCDGRGYLVETETSPCKKCEGAGKVTGGIKNDILRVCSACNGKGQFETRKRVDCPECQGKRILPCPTCNGSGLCPTCQGKKRTGGCSECGDTGTIATKCVRCSGDGKCADCVNKKPCARCDGRGLCTVCEGAKLLRINDLPADSAWLNCSSGCFVQSAPNYMVDGKPVASGAGNATWGIVQADNVEKLSRGRARLKLVSRPGEVLVISETEETGWLAGTLFKVSY